MRCAIAMLAGVIGGFGLVSVAHAHSGGVAAGGCACHGGGDVELDIDVSPMMFSPGQQVMVTVTVAKPGGVEAGLFVGDADIGSFETIAGQGLASVNSGMTHTSPKSMGGGSASFSFRWTAPDEIGAVRFNVWGVSSNNNNSSSGDNTDSAAFDFVFGCVAQEFYRDGDGDGFGRTESPLTHCAGAPPTGYAAAPGDCDDNDADHYPDALEYCNQVDDDCDGEVDENALPLDQYPDEDGDGYYGLAEFESGEMFVGCTPTRGWAAEPGDCRPTDPTVSPGHEEVCNGFDDNCDNDVDEFVRPTCGEGWCRREAPGCDPANCLPGEPRAEECNFFDDDCDGVVDNDATCPDGETCQAGECRPGEDVGEDESGDSGPGHGPGEDDGATAASSDGTAGSAGAADGSGEGCACHAAPRPVATWLGLWLGLVGFLRRRATSARKPIKNGPAARLHSS